MATLSSSGVSKLIFKGSCTDSYGQQQMVSKDVTISSGESDISMKNQPDKIIYDSSQSQDVSFLYEYTNCASSSTTTPTSTITLQKMTGVNTWADTTTASEMIQNSKTIPKGLSSTTKYRLKVVAAAGTKSKEFYIQLQFIVKIPDMQTKGIPPYLLASKDFSYTFTLSDFKNVNDLTKVSLSFTCTLWSGGKCTKADNSDLTFSSYYTDSTKTFAIPANTLKTDTWYSVGITVAYSGTTNTKNINIITAPSGVTTAIDIGFNFNAGKYIDITSSGFLSCKPRNQSIKPQDCSYSLSLLDSSGSKVTSSCITTNIDNISYSANCLSSGTSYTVTCTATSKTDSAVTGTAKQSFTTQSSVSISASITPTSGDQFTSFTISVTNSGSDTIKCSAGIVDSLNGEGFSSLTSTDLQVSGSSTSSFSSASLPVDTQSTYTKVKVYWRSPTTGDTGSSTINVQMSKYTGSDATSKASAVVDKLKSWASSTSCSSSDMVSSLMSNKQLTGYMDKSTAQTVATKVISDLSSSTVDGTDSQSKKNFMGKLDTVSDVVSVGGLDSTGITQVMGGFKTLLGTSSSTTTLADTSSSTTSASSVMKNLPKSGAESTNQISKDDNKNMLNTLSKIVDGVSNNKNLVTNLEFEKFKRDFMVIIDQLAKSTMDALYDGETQTNPLKGMTIIYKKLSMDSTSSGQQTTINFPCPCSSSYKPSTTSTDSQALTGKIDPSAASTVTTSTSTATTSSLSKYTLQSSKSIARSTDTNGCKVKIPSLNSISSYTSSWKSVMAMVTFTSNMSPNSKTSSSDSSQFKTSSA